MLEIKIRTTNKTEARDITDEVIRVVKGKEGRLLHLYTPHTTCSLLINEDADPSVMKDIIEALERIVPEGYPYKHLEGNAQAHIKSSIIGCSVIVPFSEGVPKLGTWQGIFLMEFDGPRERKVNITLI
jgi:secondary thiamine-phosphate synthase enzyme